MISNLMAGITAIHDTSFHFIKYKIKMITNFNKHIALNILLNTFGQPRGGLKGGCGCGGERRGCCARS